MPAFMELRVLKRLTHFHSTGAQGSSGWNGMVAGTHFTEETEV